MRALNRLNRYFIISTLISLALMISSSSMASSVGRCESIFDTSKIDYAYKTLNQDPFVVHNIFAARFERQKKEFPDRPYGFSTAEILDQQVKQMTSNLQELQAELETQVVDPYLLKLCAKAIRFSKKTEKSMAYDDVLALSYLHSLFMTIPVISPHSFSLYKLAKLEVVMRDPRATFDFRFKQSHPKFGFYIPEIGISLELDLVRSRSAMLYTLGLTRKYEFADGHRMDPESFFEHDMSHAARSSNHDSAILRSTEIQNLPSQYRLRFEVMQFVERIFADPNLSVLLKEFYKDRIFLVDHESVSISILNQELYLRILTSYFVDLPKQILAPVASYYDFSSAGIRSSWKRQQKMDFKYMYLNYPEFKKYWDKLKTDSSSSEMLKKALHSYN